MVEKTKKTKTVKKKAAKKTNLKRARNKKGHYIKDNPDTPDINEAYEKPNNQILQELAKKDKELLQSIESKRNFSLPGILLALVLIGLMFLAAN